MQEANDIYYEVWYEEVPGRVVKWSAHNSPVTAMDRAASLKSNWAANVTIKHIKTTAVSYPFEEFCKKHQEELAKCQMISSKEHEETLTQKSSLSEKPMEEKKQ